MLQQENAIMTLPICMLLMLRFRPFFLAGEPEPSSTVVRGVLGEAETGLRLVEPSWLTVEADIIINALSEAK